MNKAAAIVIPAALFAAAIWAITLGIDRMVAQERNNHAIARLMGCEYHVRLDAVPNLLIFDCAGSIEIHKEIKW